MIKGTQSLDRAFQLLNIVADQNDEGLTFQDILEISNFTRPTARRFLLALMGHGFVIKNEENKRYYLGPKIFELGLQVLPIFDFSNVYLPSINKLVETTGDTVFLNRVVGQNTLCLAREAGSFPVKAFVTDVGVRRPLGTGAGGIAVLSAMKEKEVELIITRNAKHFHEHHLDLETVKNLISDARKTGYVVRDISKLGIRTIAMPIHDSAGNPFASISVSSIFSRMSGKHFDLVIDTLREEIAIIDRKLDIMRPMHSNYN